MTPPPPAEPAGAAETIRAFLGAAGLEFEEAKPGAFAVVLPGTKKLRTTVSLLVGSRSLSVNAFVVRHPDENADLVHRWLLERNRRTYAVAYAIDHLGDVYLTGRIPLGAVTPDELDRVLGAVLEYADGAFNTLLEMGFPTAIRREWAWRTSHGEPTDNLAAFRHLVDHEPPESTPPPSAGAAG